MSASEYMDLFTCMELIVNTTENEDEEKQTEALSTSTGAEECTAGSGRLSLMGWMS